jgi:hypothetical protein
MRRTAAILGLFAALGLLAWAGAAPVGDVKDKPDPKSEVKAKADDGPAAKLAERFDFIGIDDPKATLQEALELLSRGGHVDFEINQRAFAAETFSAEEFKVADPKPIPPRKNARLADVLNQVLSRVQSPNTGERAVFLVRRDRIEITTGRALRTEIWGEGFNGPFLPLVNARLEKKPLDEALGQLADETDFNVVLDRRAADKASTPVSARFRNAPLDTAVRLLAESAELKVVQRDNVLFVTTAEHAAALEKAFAREKPSDQEASDMQIDPRKWRRGSGHAQGVPPPMLGGM